MNRYILLAILVVVVVGGVILYSNSQESEDSSSATNQTETPADASSQPADGIEALPTEEAELVSVRETNEIGVAEQTFVDGNYTLNVTANLRDLPSDKFYEGWVVGDGRVVSTGKLVEEGSGQFSQTFTSTEDLRQQSEVVITEETLANGLDNKPETHVIEGSF